MRDDTMNGRVVPALSLSQFTYIINARISRQYRQDHRRRLFDADVKCKIGLFELVLKINLWLFMSFNGSIPAICWYCDGLNHSRTGGWSWWIRNHKQLVINSAWFILAWAHICFYHYYAFIINIVRNCHFHQLTSNFVINIDTCGVNSPYVF